MIGARSRYLAFSVCRHQSEKSWGSRRCFGVCGKHVGGTWNAAKPCRNSFVIRAIRALFSLSRSIFGGSATGASHVGPAHRTKVSYVKNRKDCDSKWRVDLRLCNIQHFCARSFDTSAASGRNYRIFQDDDQANRNVSYMPKSVE